MQTPEFGKHMIKRSICFRLFVKQHRRILFAQFHHWQSTLCCIKNTTYGLSSSKMLKACFLVVFFVFFPWCHRSLYTVDPNNEPQGIHPAFLFGSHQESGVTLISKNWQLPSSNCNVLRKGSTTIPQLVLFCIFLNIYLSNTLLNFLRVSLK